MPGQFYAMPPGERLVAAACFELEMEQRRD